MADTKLRVLYIDDDPGLARLVSRSLGRRGYEVEHCVDAETGLKRIEEGDFDVVGLDHYLPSGTGLDVLKILGTRDRMPPVVYVTGSAETAIAVAALKAGAYDYVAKSVSEDFLELLASAIDQAVERAQLLAERGRVEAELREAKERAEMLLGEVNHRVANSLAMVASLVRMQANAVADGAAKDALAETQARISAIAGVHRRLYTSGDVRSVEIAEYLSGLMGEIGSSIGAGRLALTLEPVSIATDKAVSVGVIAAELVTNAMKYAYPDGADGEVRVRLETLGDTQACLMIEDDGIGWTGDGPIKGTGLGSRLIRAMASNLGTALRYDPLPKGTRAVLEFSV